MLTVVTCPSPSSNSETFYVTLASCPVFSNCQKIICSKMSEVIILAPGGRQFSQEQRASCTGCFFFKTV